ncbi:MAG TPA: alpha/beta hydrolase [Tepidisphaeraceae bacterium]|nr:alpha/beta hydrolase [Tepidisphaeraceae bacterium]
MLTLNVRGCDIRYTDAGHGTPIVLLHGFPLDRRVYTDVAARLSASKRVICPDLPGFGESRCDRDFTIASLAEDVRAFIDALELGPVVLGGLSMGGYVAQAFAKAHPEALRALILIDTKADADNAEQKLGRLKMIDLVRSEGSAGVARAMFPKMLMDEKGESNPIVAAKLKQIMLDCPPKTIERACLAMKDRDDFNDTLRALAVPGLMIVGRHDAISPLATAERSRNRCRTARSR